MISRASSVGKVRRGMVIGELLVGVLLLLVAVSSVAALMYSVSRRDDEPRLECVAGSTSKDAKCVAPKVAATASKVVKAATNTVCSAKSAALTKECSESPTPNSGGVVLKARTDSAALAIIAKRERASRRAVRTDLGFVH